VAGDAAVEGVLAGLQVDLLRLRRAPAVGLERVALVRAVEDEVVDAGLRGQLDLGDAGLGGDLVGLEVEVARLDRDGLGRRTLRLDVGRAASTTAAATAAG
jgi:hypothetical protein